MPSGPRKRKAAKKRRDNEAHNKGNHDHHHSSSIYNVHGCEDDIKHEDERESDGGSADSCLSQDHYDVHNDERHPFSEESNKKGPLTSQSFGSENLTVEGVAEDVEGSNEVEEDDHFLKLDKERLTILNEERNGTLFHSKEKAVDASQSTTQISQSGKLVNKANNNSGLETVSEVDTVPPLVPMSEVGRSSLEGIEGETLEFLDVVKLETEENMEKLLPIWNDHAGVSLSSVSHEKEDKCLLGDIVGQLSTLSGTVKNENNTKTSEVPDILTASNDIGYTKDSDGPIYANEGKSLPAASKCAVETNNDAQNVNDFETSDVSENQPLVGSAPRVTQRTSWLSCCGLFEVFTGSNR
ncbi:hypothetical protein K2173_001237 [Erythroxylum novogranatense]|uniref:Uncharacterized protein n=1 Tax=Erythroxylum novogranatense TaxID=1862640 RepID=A0AAV8T352_9ROSI|nr:hypothetical protein K2173_001237 [Erythroxylum novogranatense]